MSENGNTSNSGKAQKMDLAEFLEELGGGVFAGKIIRALQDTSLSVATYGDKGRGGDVTVKFSMKRIGESNQVSLDHKLAYKRLTKRGAATEEDTTTTPMHVGAGGKLSLMPDTQERFDFARDDD